MLYRNNLTQKELQQWVTYDPLTGYFHYTKEARPGCPRVAVDLADGYVGVRIKGYTYQAARLALLYMTGKWPEEVVDHIDRDKKNNKFINLRPATQKQNAQNNVAQSQFPLGVTSHSAGKVWYAGITNDGIYKHLGAYKTVDEAAHAYNKEAIATRGDFAVLNPVGY